MPKMGSAWGNPSPVPIGQMRKMIHPSVIPLAGVITGIQMRVAVSAFLQPRVKPRAATVELRVRLEAADHELANSFTEFPQQRLYMRASLRPGLVDRYAAIYVSRRVH